MLLYQCVIFVFYLRKLYTIWNKIYEKCGYFSLLHYILEKRYIVLDTSKSEKLKMLSVHVYLKFEILSSKFTSNGTSCCASYEFQNLMMKSTGKISGLIITVRNVAAARLFSQASVILFTGGGVSQHALGQIPPPRRRLQRTLRILLECILVSYLN